MFLFGILEENDSKEKELSLESPSPEPITSPSKWTADSSINQECQTLQIVQYYEVKSELEQQESISPLSLNCDE